MSDMHKGLQGTGGGQRTRARREGISYPPAIPELIAPRILAKPTAAAYCGLTEAGFDDWVKRGLLPKAMKGTRRWDKVALDLALDRLSGIDRNAPAPKPSGLAEWVGKRAARKAAEAAQPVLSPITKRRGANRDRT